MGKALLEFDRKAFANCDWIIGIDEAGRGALAGPVVAAAACLNRNFYSSRALCERVASVNDSKKLGSGRRKAVYNLLERLAEEGCITIASGLASVAEIERENILGATRLAMRRALEAAALHFNGACFFPGKGRQRSLFQTFGEGEKEPGRAEGKDRAMVGILIDGRSLEPFPYPHRAVVKGDAKSFAIAAASIVAKVRRDRFMDDLGRQFPDYSFSEHKGYATAKHRAAILGRGPSPAHRPTFLRKLLALQEGDRQIRFRFQNAQCGVDTFKIRD